MRGPRTAKQVAYHAYQQTEHWRALRAAALERDWGRCVDCGKTELLHVHHLEYRGRFEDSVLKDVVTLCQTHHRMMHGLPCISDFERKKRAMDKIINRIECPDYTLPPESDWVELAGLVEDESQARELEGMLRLSARIRTARCALGRTGAFCLKMQPDGSSGGAAEWCNRLWAWARKRRVTLQEKHRQGVRQA